MAENEFKPDWVSPPGETISDIMEMKGWTNAEIAAKLDIHPDRIVDLLLGTMVIDEDLAHRLHAVFGAPWRFWLSRERQYREDQARIESEDRCPSPRMAEVLIYENRNRGHVVVVKVDGNELRGEVERQWRAPLWADQTADMVRFMLRALSMKSARDEDNNSDE